MRCGGPCECRQRAISRRLNMQIDHEYQIWNAVALHEERPALQMVQIEATGDGKGVAVAADGFIMAVVPVTLEPDDILGPVHYSAFKRAFRIKQSKRMMPTLILNTPGIVGFVDGSTCL